MYSVIEGCSPQTGHDGSFLTVTSSKVVCRASKSSRRPVSVSPAPRMSATISGGAARPLDRVFAENWGRDCGGLVGRSGGFALS